MQEELDPPRALIKAAIDAQGLNLAKVSSAIGRNPAYLQQFLKRRIPAVLSETDREALSCILGVPADKLRGATPGKGGPKALAPDAVALSQDEVELLRAYRQIPEDLRPRAIAVIKAMG